MEYDTSSSIMNQGNYSTENQVSNSMYTLFDKNLHRINKNLEYVNEYYVPKFEHTVENHSKVVESKELTKSLNDKTDRSINFYTELHKITMNEIETRRKMHVRKMLNQKANNWEYRRRECSNITKNKNEGSRHLIRERLTISRNYTQEWPDNNNDKLKIRLLEEQNKFDQKSRSIKFALALKIASSLLNDIKKMLSENLTTPQLLNYHMHSCQLFEADINAFNNISQNSNDNDILALSELVQNIQIFNEQLMKSVTKKSQVDYVSFKTDGHGNEENKMPYENNSLKINHKSEEPKNEIQSFTFKVDENHVVKSEEFSTFKFKVDENVAPDSNISNFSFKNEILKLEEVKNNITHYFEEDYNQFLENHLAIQKYLKEVEKLYSSFLHNDNLKSLRQELIKAINTPVNSISSVSSWHLKDKFDKLNELLKCKTVKTGNSTVSANSHQDALIFCKDTLAKKIINIGEQVASVKTETAFEVASVVTELWQIYPDFGMLLYARFKEKCPCLIPYNAAKTKEETDEEYYKSLGYHYVDGIVEKQDKYVKRMTGIIRLFAAIIVTETKSGKALGIGQAWMLIAATVQLVPQLDITAVLLHEMLMITGCNLNHAYGRQFIKMLKYIDASYMKKIDEVTPTGRGGPVQRLKTFISKIIQQGYIDKPKGVIPYNFW